MNDSQLATLVIAVFAFGVVSVTTIATQNRARWRLAFLIGAGAAIFINLQRAETEWGPFLRDMVLSVGAALIACAFISTLIWAARRPQRETPLEGWEYAKNPRIWWIAIVVIGFIFIMADEAGGKGVGAWVFGAIAGVIVGGLVGAFTAYLIGGFWNHVRSAFAELPGRLNPKAWDGSIEHVRPPKISALATKGPINPQDMARRWFVTVAASVGAVAFSLMSDGGFWSTFAKNFQPIQVVSAMVVAAVAVVLIGPLQDFVLARSIDDGENGGARPDFADAISKANARRSALRLILVFALALTFLELINNALDQSIQNDSVASTMIIMMASIGPAVVTYYWSAALQYGAPRKEVGPLVTQSVVAWFMVLLYLPGVAICVQAALSANVGDPDTARGAAFLLVFSPLVGAFVAGVLGFFAAGVYAFIGGFAWNLMEDHRWVASIGAALIVLVVAHLLLRVLIGAAPSLMVGALCAATAGYVDWRANRSHTFRIMTTIGGAIIIATFVQHGLGATLTAVAYGESTWGDYDYMLAGGLGWFVGLIAAGFPRIVMNYPALAGVQAPP